MKIHANLVLHRDLKPENVLLNPPSPRTVNDLPSAEASTSTPTVGGTTSATQSRPSHPTSAADSRSEDAMVVKLTDFGLARQYLPPQREYTGKVREAEKLQTH